MSQLVYVIAFLVVLLVLNSVLSPRVSEHFALDETSIPINILRFTGRNLKFNYFGNYKQFTAGQRAQIDLSLATIPYGKCPASNSQLNESFSVVSENGVYYTLKKSCISLPMSSYKYDAMNSTYIVQIPIDTPQKVDSFAKFILVNPLFVEFTYGVVTSVAYIPQVYRDVFGDRGFYFTNYVDGTDYWKRMFNPKTIEVRFRLATMYDKGTCDTLFDYKNNARSQVPLTEEDMALNQHDGCINMWVYYLDELTSNFQNTGRSLQIDPTAKGQITVFTPDFKNWSANPYKLNSYQFMNNINQMYLGFIIPVLTFSFDLVMTADVRYSNYAYFQLMKCYVDNGYYGGNGECNNNVMSVGVNTFDNGWNLTVTVGDGGDCGNQTWYSPVMALWLPWMNVGTVVSVTVVLGPNQKHGYAEWKDVNGGDIGKKFAYAKSVQNFLQPPYDSCQAYDDTAMRETNNFTKMFASKNFPDGQRPRLGPMQLIWQPNYVKKITSIKVGYENFNYQYGSP